MTNTALKGKRILFICPPFFDYHTVIGEELNALGAIVDYFADRPLNFTYVVLRNINEGLLLRYQKMYWKGIIRRILDNQYDYLFVIRGERLPKMFFDFFQSSSPKAHKIMYQWDSMKNNDYSKILPFFHRVFTFDRADAEMLENTTYHPLFYRKEYEMIPASQNRHEALFIGTYQPARYQSLLKLIKHFNEMQINIKILLYIPFYHYLKLFFQGRRVNLNITTFKSVPFKKVLKMYEKASIIIDLAHEQQTGLTMRTMEALGANKYLLTNNINIKREEFYNEHEIFMISEPIKLSNEKPTAVSSKIKKYRIDSWILSLFSDEHTN